MTSPSDAISTARGDVRDGVAAIEHFLHVLASRRVGPRMLARAVPEMEAGYAPLRAAFASFERALAVELAGDPEGLGAVHELLAYAAARVDELGATLSAHRRPTMDARERLALEAVVRRVAGELAAVVGLVDLLGAQVTSEKTTIDLADALAVRRRPSGAAAASSRTGPTVVRAAVEQRTGDLVVGDARLTLELLELAVLCVARAGILAPRIVVESGTEGFPVLTVEEAPPGHAGHVGGLGLEVALRDELPREMDVARAAARHVGIELRVAEGGRRVTIAL